MKRVLMIVAVGVCLGFAGVAYAGLAFSSQVVVQSSYAYGSTDAARYSSNDTEYIYCSVNGSNTVMYTRCNARDASGNTLSCYSQSDRIAEAAAAVDAHSRIYFAVQGGECGNIQISKGSLFLP